MDFTMPFVCVRRKNQIPQRSLVEIWLKTPKDIPFPQQTF